MQMKMISSMVIYRLFYRRNIDEHAIEAVDGPYARQEVRNERALAVYNRVQHKLTGLYPDS